MQDVYVNKKKYQPYMHDIIDLKDSKNLACLDYIKNLFVGWGGIGGMLGMGGVLHKDSESNLKLIGISTL